MPDPRLNVPSVPADCDYCNGLKNPDGEAELLKCSRCSDRWLCSRECQTADWKLLHSKICKPLQPLPEEDDILNTVKQGSKEFQEIMTNFKGLFKSWSEKARDTFRNQTLKVKLKLPEETQALVDYAMTVPSPFAFPSPEAQLVGRKTMLTATKCYWLYVHSILTPKQIEGVTFTLRASPPYQNKIPTFNFARCLQYPGYLTIREYNGLMRIMVPCLMNAAQGQQTPELRELVKEVEDFCTAGIFIYEDLDDEGLTKDDATQLLEAQVSAQMDA